MIICSGSILIHRWVLTATHCGEQPPMKAVLFKTCFGIDTHSQERPASKVKRKVGYPRLESSGWWHVCCRHPMKYSSAIARSQYSFHGPGELKNQAVKFCEGKKDGPKSKSTCGKDSGSAAVIKGKDNNSWVALDLAVQSRCRGAIIFMLVPYFGDDEAVASSKMCSERWRRTCCTKCVTFSPSCTFSC